VAFLTEVAVFFFGGGLLLRGLLHGPGAWSTGRPARAVGQQLGGPARWSPISMSSPLRNEAFVVPSVT